MLSGKRLIILGIILVGFVLLVLAKKSVVPKEVVATPKASIMALESQSGSLGAVTVEVTPEKLGKNEEQNIFEVRFNTHSVNLEFDFAKIMVLTDDLGNSYQAQAWSGGQGGHHLSGKIVFPKLKPGVKKVNLRISGIEGGEQSLNWEI